MNTYINEYINYDKDGVIRMKGLFFIINQHSGFGRGEKAWKKVKKELEKKKISFRSFYTDYHGHAEVLARQIATIQDYHLKTIIGVGGNGTMNEIVNGLSGFTKVKIAFLYTGRTTQRSHTRLSSNPSKAIKDILKMLSRPVKKIDLVEYQLEGKGVKRNYFNNLGMGLTTKVIEQENLLKKELMKPILGRIRFMTGFVKVLWDYQPISILMKTENQEIVQHDHVWLLSVSNQPCHWAGIKIAPKAKENDGMLTITMIKNISLFQLVVFLVFKQMSHRVKQNAFSEFTCEKITISTNAVQAIEADGELIGESPVTVVVKKSHSELVI